MPLPAYLARAFQRINPETTQVSNYYGTYTMLLVHAFLGQEGYVIHPQVSLLHPLFSLRMVINDRFHRVTQVVMQSTL
jgi:hypothetical protein